VERLLFIFRKKQYIALFEKSSEVRQRNGTCSPCFLPTIWQIVNKKMYYSSFKSFLLFVNLSDKQIRDNCIFLPTKQPFLALHLNSWFCQPWFRVVFFAKYYVHVRFGSKTWLQFNISKQALKRARATEKLGIFFTFMILIFNHNIWTAKMHSSRSTLIICLKY